MVLCLDAANPRNFDLTKVEVLVVAGGGGGGGRHAGGGGAGGLIYNSNFAVTPGTQLTATVGDGGAGSSFGGRGGNGGNSVFGALTSIGGGGGGGYDNGNPTVNGATGGSGGGGAAATGLPGGNGTGASGTSGQGNAGATPISFSDWAGGGGGGAGENGYASSGSIGGNGGNGLGFNISGTFTYYGGGGGGGGGNNIDSNGGLGGLGGGGRGTGAYNPTQGVSGQSNTGGGGGGSRDQAGPTGGSGIIIVRYPGPQKAIGGTITSVGGDTIHTFTTSGNFTPLVNTNGSAVLGLSDLSGNRNFGKSEGGVLYSSANGGSIVFDGTDDYVDLGSDKVFKTTGGWTVESWVNYDVIPTTYNNTTSPANFIGSETVTHNSWFWSVLESKLSLWNISPGVWKHGSTILQAYTWYNAVLVCYNSGTSYQMYLNGIAEGGDHTAYSWNASYSGLNIRYIGRGNSANVRLVDGKIPITKVYDRALSAAEISQNFNALRGRYGL